MPALNRFLTVPDGQLQWCTPATQPSCYISPLAQPAADIFQRLYVFPLVTICKMYALMVLFITLNGWNVALTSEANAVNSSSTVEKKCNPPKLLNFITKCNIEHVKNTWIKPHIKQKCPNIQRSSVKKTNLCSFLHTHSHNTQQKNKKAKV